MIDAIIAESMYIHFGSFFTGIYDSDLCHDRFALVVPPCRTSLRLFIDFSLLERCSSNDLEILLNFVYGP